MKSLQRKVTFVTSPGKRYTGMLDVPTETFRTTDLLNSSHVYWKNPDMKCFDNAVFLSDVQLAIEDKSIYRKFKSIQVKLSEIIYFYDHSSVGIGDAIEKKRAVSLKKQTKEDAQTLNFITTRIANSFYDITGEFFGLFRKKARDAFVPITQARITEVYKTGGKWYKKEVKLPTDYICVSTRRIEAVTFL